MRKTFVLLCLVSSGFLQLAAAQDTQKTYSHSKRPVTIADAIRMTKLADPDYWLGAPSRGHVAQFSPDGKQFVVVVRKGNLEQNTNEYSMLFWRTEEVFRSPTPRVLLTMSSSSNRQAIHDVEWLPDNETVEFLGENLGERGQLYAFSIKTGKLRKVSKSPDNLLAYSTTPNGNHVAYVAEGPAESLWDEKARSEGIAISRQVLYKLLTGQKGEDWGTEKRLLLQQKNGESHRLYSAGKIEFQYGKNPRLSPDGKYIVLLSHVATFPETWNGYSNPDLQTVISQKWARGQYTWVTRFELIDTSTGRRRILLDAPESSWETEFLWSPDSHSVIIANTYLPLDHADSDDLEARKSKKFTVEVKVPNGDIAPISEEGLEFLAWDTKVNLPVLEARGKNDKPESRRRMLFRKIGEKWERVEEVPSEGSRPEIVLEEGMNIPSKIFALDSRTQRRALLLDLNPQFEDLRFGAVQEITWKGFDGIEVKGGLYYPVNYVPGKRYPLVIQTHSWNPDRFWIDGPWTTAYAAQPLVGKDIIVLQGAKWSVDDQWWNAINATPNEVNVEVATYEKAIDYLDEKGLIDRNRVGVIGFSRTSMYVKYVLTHSRYRFAAASVTDGVDAGYLQYIKNVKSNPGYISEMEGINGGLPFGEGLKTWLKNSPGFSVDKVRTPLRIVVPSPAQLLSEWEWFAALSRLGKPVDMVMLQDGEHFLQRPWERIISQQGNVDWFDFWLNGSEDSNPAKAEQYARWRQLRKLQEENEAKAKAANEKPVPVN